MVNAQEYVNKNYPFEEKEKITKLDLTQKNLKGSLKIEGFSNLNELNLSYNRISELEINDCSQLVKVNCADNSLTNLTISNCEKLNDIRGEHNQIANLKVMNCPKLAGIDCRENLLTNGKNLKISHPEKLSWINLSDNNFEESDLSFLTPFVNLTWLSIHNDNKERMDKDLYNRFTGSLKYLWKLKKLNYLNISNTDLDSGVEYLPESLEREFFCWADLNPQAKVAKIDAMTKDCYYYDPHLPGTCLNKWTYRHDIKKWKLNNRGLVDVAQDQIEEWEKELVGQKNDNEESADSLTIIQKTQQSQEDEVSQLQVKISELEKQISEKDQKLNELLIQNENLQKQLAERTESKVQIPSQNSLTVIVPEAEREQLNNLLQNYLGMMKKEAIDCQLIVNYDGANQQEKEHFSVKKQQLEYKIEQVQSFLKK